MQLNNLQNGKKMNDKDKKFDEFIGSVSSEDDNGWSKEVWDMAWQSALDSLKEESIA